MSLHFDVVCAVHRIAMCIKVHQLDTQILIMCLYLSLSALNLSDSLVPHQERHLELYIAIGILEHLMINKDTL